MPERITYCDMHCDALTNEGVLQVTAPRLGAGGCLLQCFAAFTGGGGYARAAALAVSFDRMCLREGYVRVRSAQDLKRGAVNALLTVEGDALEGDLSRIDALYSMGVRMMGFVWNEPTTLGTPAFADYEGVRCGRVPLSERNRSRCGLTPFGREALERMNELHILADVSHGSDALVEDVVRFSRAPVVASHTCADAVHPCARNLTCEKIAKIAAGGGVVGLCLCSDFLGGARDAEGQRQAILAHARAIIGAGGEDVLALGSDFDGIPPNAFVPDPSFLPRLFGAFCRQFGSRAAEKFARGNFLRVLSVL